MFTGAGLANQFINNRLRAQRGRSTLVGSALGAAYGGISADSGEGWSGAAMGAGLGAGLGRYSGAALRSGRMSYAQAVRRGAPGGAAGISGFLGAGRSTLNQIRKDGKSLIAEGRRSADFFGANLNSNKGNAMSPMLNHPQRSTAAMSTAGRSFIQDSQGITMVNQELMNRASIARANQFSNVGNVRARGNSGYGRFNALLGSKKNRRRR